MPTKCHCQMAPKCSGDVLPLLISDHAKTFGPKTKQRRHYSGRITRRCIRRSNAKAKCTKPPPTAFNCSTVGFPRSTGPDVPLVSAGVSERR